MFDKNDNSELDYKLMYLAERQRNEDLLADIIDMNKENDFLKGLLKKDFKEIANYSKEFSVNYENLLLRIGEALVTQRAYKELSFQLGEELGLSLDEIRMRANSLESNVLKNENEKNHHTNISDSNFISSISNRLLRKLTRRKIG